VDSSILYIPQNNYKLWQWKKLKKLKIERMPTRCVYMFTYFKMDIWSRNKHWSSKEAKRNPKGAKLKSLESNIRINF
jgi:hypothetical protein